MITSFKAKTGKQVEVIANGGSYKGILKAITEDEVYLKTSTKTWALPIAQVRSIREVLATSSLQTTPEGFKTGFDTKTDPYGGEPT